MYCNIPGLLFVVGFKNYVTDLDCKTLIKREMPANQRNDAKESTSQTRLFQVGRFALGSTVREYVYSILHEI